MTDDQFKQLVIDKIKSGSSIIWLYSTGDEERSQFLLNQIAQNLTKLDSDQAYNIGTWDWVNGSSWDLSEPNKDPKNALNSIQKYTETIFVFKDLSNLLNVTNNTPSTVLRRQFIDLCQQGYLNSSNNGNVIIILADTPVPHSDLKDYVDVADVPLPGVTHMEAILQEIIEAWSFGNDTVDIDDDIAEHIVQALLGLTSAEAVRILAYASRVAKGFNTTTIEIISEEKVKFVRKIEGLTFVPNSKIMSEEDIGGYAAFKSFIAKRAKAYTKHAQSIGLERPRGVAIVGLPGTGKTAVAKVVARMLGLDLIIMDMSSFLDSYVGNSEKKQRAALATISAMPNSLVLVDEIDKLFSGTHNGSNDSGVTSHLLSTFLAWLNDRDMTDPESNRVFVAVTANRINNLPPELLRAGRFDRIFGVDLPNENERRDILAIHFRKRGINPYNYDLECVAKQTTDFSGAELEELVITARHDAYNNATENCDNINELTADDVAPDMDDLVTAAASIKPLAVLDREAVTELRKFCAERTYMVGEEINITTNGHKRRLVAS